MALFLSEDVVKNILTMPMALAAVEEAHRELALGRATDVPRQRTRLPQTTLHILQAALPKRDVVGYKAYTSSRSGVRFLIHLYQASTGKLIAVLEADLIGMMRTAAASGVATRLLARSDVGTAGIFGAGWQAEGHLEALLAVRPLQRIMVYSRRGDRLHSFCRRMSERLATEIIAASSPEEAVRGCDIVSTVTTAATPLFDANWLTPGSHINAAGSNSLIRREIGEDVLKRCDMIVVDSVETAVREAGDLLPVLEKGRLQVRQLIELGDLLCERQAGRSSTEAITLFESQGMAIQDLALAAQVVELARDAKLGIELPYGLQ